MTKSEAEARQHPICQEYRRISLLLSYALRGKTAKGFVYHRDSNNPYSITISRGSLRFRVWFFSGGPSGKEVFTTVERRTRKSRGITTDPDLKILLGAAPNTTAVTEVLRVLRENGAIRS